MERTLENRQVGLEIKLAEASGVQVKHIRLISDPPVPIWDFRHSMELMEQGYRITRQATETWQPVEQPAWWSPARVKTMFAGLVNILD